MSLRLLRDALAKTAKRSRQGRRNFFPYPLNTLRFECRISSHSTRSALSVGPSMISNTLKGEAVLSAKQRSCAWEICKPRSGVKSSAPPRTAPSSQAIGTGTEGLRSERRIQIAVLTFFTLGAEVRWLMMKALSSSTDGAITFRIKSSSPISM